MQMKEHTVSWRANKETCQDRNQTMNQTLYSIQSIDLPIIHLITSKRSKLTFLTDIVMQL